MRFKLDEASRRELIDKGKRGDNYSVTNQGKGKNRYHRRKHSKIINRVKTFNEIDMNSFFKEDILTIGIPVVGETNEYKVLIKFNGVLKEIQKNVKANNNTFDFRIISQSLSKVFNSGDVYMHCSCPDFQYRFSYWATKNNYTSGPAETRSAKITNPTDSKGSGCKHSLLTISNIEWMIKIASVINNYSHYMEKNYEKAFADIIFPAIYGVTYNKAIQLSIFDEDDLSSDKSLIDTINEFGRKRTQYKKEPFKSVNPRFKKPAAKKDDIDDGKFNLFDLKDEEEQENEK